MQTGPTPHDRLPALGAHFDGNAVDFAVFSHDATLIELCLYDPHHPTSETARHAMARRGDIWHARIPGAQNGTLYGFRAHGPYDPGKGLRFNPNKLLMDPCATMITGPLRWDDACFGYIVGDVREDHSFSPRDSAPFVPRSMVASESFDWQGDERPQVPWRDTLVYECHVRGMTRLHDGIPPELRGTYLGLAHHEVINHLQSLGATTVELLPVHHSISRRWLVHHGLSNYWGYDTLGFFAPDERFASAPGRQVQEFKSMVRSLHRAGIEVILDVVYNHTCESDRLGPSLFLRGLDNRAYYRLDPGQPREYENVTGCGNTLNLNHPHVLRFVLDSLRYWAEVMHVDGFRLDLATALARGHAGFDPDHPFLRAVQEDPVLSQLKWIAEPWDVGWGGYQLGRFPRGWAEWNDQYRDGVRRFWRGDGTIAELASRFAGSSDIFTSRHRPAWSSLNFVTCHDGFTLRDLVSYEHKHNHANGEKNRDGTAQNFSRNWGVEGPTDRTDILALRRRVQRSMLATLMLSVGTPMLSAGDELDHTQDGNNNAYCHDHELTWLNWTVVRRDSDLLTTIRRLAEIRRTHSMLRRERFLRGAPEGHHPINDVSWLAPSGEPMQLHDWHDAHRRALGILLANLESPPPPGMLLLLINGAHQPCAFALPAEPAFNGWRVILDTNLTAGGPTHRAAGNVTVAAHALMVLDAELP